MSSTRRRSTSSFAIPPKPEVPAESDEDEEEENEEGDEEEGDEDEEDEESGEDHNDSEEKDEGNSVNLKLPVHYSCSDNVSEFDYDIIFCFSVSKWQFMQH